MTRSDFPVRFPVVGTPGPTGPTGPTGPQGPTGPTGPAGSTPYDAGVYVYADQGITGSSSNNQYVTSPTACTLTLPPSTGSRSVHVSWSLDFMRTNTGGGNRCLGELVALTAPGGSAISHLVGWRYAQSMENGSDSAMPGITDFASSGDVALRSGEAIVLVPANTPYTFALRYAINNNSNPGTVMRVRNQVLFARYI